MDFLEYENQIFLDSFHEDGLLVMAQGLGVDRIFANFLRAYSDPGSLVLVLNTTPKDEEYFMELLETHGVKPLPKVITNEFNAIDRQAVYLQGGVLFITSRILVVDLLTDRVPTDKVSGILVYRAHRIMESCQEAFILRMYRQKNKDGFIKAFTQNPEAFGGGFCKVEQVMRNLFVRKLFLWPRFHASVVAMLEKTKVEVVELHIDMTAAMTVCQTALLDLINACIQELKRCTPAVDAEEITVENALGKSFEKTIRMQLDPIWHQLGQKTRQLVSDLNTLRLILQYLTQYDAVTFYSLVHSVRTSEKTFGQNTGWLFLDAADSLFVHARQRVYGPEEKRKDGEKSNKDSDAVPTVEKCPKWQTLTDVLKEIEEENKTNKETELGPGQILICAEDDRTCHQLREYMCVGGDELMNRLFNKYIAVKSGQALLQTKQKKTAKGQKGKKKKTTPGSSSEITLAQMARESATTEDENMEANDKGDIGIESASESDEDDDYPMSTQDQLYGVLEEPVAVLHPLHGSADPHSLSRTLRDLRPRYVILYDASMPCVRQLEVYQTSNPGMPLRVYFMIYSSSVEEQRYLTSLRKEKEAFEKLIMEKGSMVIPEERDGKLENDPSLARESTAASSSSRQAGGQRREVKQKIIVDMREFRSELPSLIHRRGIDIEPVTLEVGDYILTPDICVERKSVSDLIGSLNNGRLYNQCVSMCRCYKRPVLLIEFDANKAFALQSKYQMSSEVSLQDVSTRLALLTIHFPKLRILWCQSPYTTAEIFEELKVGREQPNAATAMTVSGVEDSIEWNDKYSHGPQDMLLRMPGINSKNYRRVMNSVRDLAELSELSEERLAEILGSSVHAQQLHSFLHGQQHQSLTEPKPQRLSTKSAKGFKRKR